MVNDKMRIPFWDITKFIAILMVIVWHMIYCAPDWCGGEKHSYLVNFIIGMNMPLFFAIAGYFSRHLMVERSMKAFAFRMITYIWPLVVFSGLIVVKETLVNGDSLLNTPYRFLKCLVFNCWFLNCLLLCEFLSFAIFFFSRGNRRWLLTGIVICFVLLWSSPWGLWCSLAMMPFFWLGTFVLPIFVGSRSCLRAGCAAAVIYIVIVLLEGNVVRNGLGFYWIRMPLYAFSWHGFVLMMLRYLIGALGVIGLLATVKCACERFGRVNVLSPLGTQTLGVYLMHSLVVADVSKALGDVSSSLASKIGCAVLLFFACHYLVVATKQSSSIALVFWGPSKSILERFLQRKAATNE